MALDDRDYMQDAQHPAHTPRGGLLDLRATWLKLVMVNMVIFLAYQPEPGVRELLETHFMVSGSRLSDGYVWTIFTSAFFHMEFAHLFWNMVFLMLFARDLEVLYSGRNLVALYVFCALGAALTQLAFQANSQIGMLGASGAVMGIVIVAAMHFPQRRIMVFPLWTLAVLFILLDLSGAAWTLSGAGGGVAYGAHLGGAVAGAAFKVFDLRPFSATTPDAAILGPGLFARVGRARRVVGPRPPNRDQVPLNDRIAPPRDALANEVDDILRKINRDGIESLTDHERAVLEQASQSYRSSRHGKPR